MGFDNECILNIQSLAGEFFCPVCRLLVYPNEALQSQCTHLYCKPCLTYVVGTTRACPYDGYLVTEADSKPLVESNKALADTIGKITVHCLYHRSGCTWQGPLSECTAHCSGCAFGNSPVVCNRCGIQIVHRQVQEHAQNCPSVQPQAQQAAGGQETAVSGTTATAGQTQVASQAETAISQTLASQTTTSSTPVQDPNQHANPNSQSQAVSQAAVVMSEQWYQQQQQQYQQYYQQYSGYDPYYQQYYPFQQQAVPQYQQQPLQVNASHMAGQHSVYMQTQPQPQPQVQPQPQLQSQVQPQPQAQPQSHLSVQAPVASQPQNQAQVNQQQQIHLMIPPQSQIPSQTYPTAQGHSQPQVQPFPQAQPHPQVQTIQPHLQHGQMPQYQQHHSQMQQPQPQLHPAPQAQPEAQLQPQSQPQPLPQPQLQPHPLQSQPLNPNLIPQMQHPAAHAVTGHQSYPQSQTHQQIQLVTPQNPLHMHAQGGLHPQQHPAEMQNSYPQQPPLMRPPQSHATIPNQQQPGLLPLPGPMLQQVHPNSLRPTLSVQQRPTMQPPASPMSQQYVQQQPLSTQPVGLVQPQMHQQGPFVQQQQSSQSQLWPPGPPHSFQQPPHAYPQPQQNVAGSHIVHPHSSHNLVGRPMTPNHVVQPQPYPQSAAGMLVKPMQLGANLPSSYQSNVFRTNNQSGVNSQPMCEVPGDHGTDKNVAEQEADSSSQGIAKKKGNELDVASSLGADVDETNASKSNADLKSVDEKPPGDVGDNSSGYDKETPESRTTDLEPHRDPVSKNTVKGEATEDLKYVDNGERKVEENKIKDGPLLKTPPLQEAKLGEEQNGKMQKEKILPQDQVTSKGPAGNGFRGIPPSSQVQPGGFLQPSHSVPIIDQGRHQPLQMPYGSNNNQQRPAASAMLQTPPPGLPSHAQTTGLPPNQFRPQGPGRTLVPPENLVPGSFGRGPSNYGPQGPYIQGPVSAAPRISLGETLVRPPFGTPPLNAFDLHGALPYGPEGHSVQQRSANMDYHADNRQLDPRASGVDSTSTFSLHGERLKPAQDEHLNPFPLDHAHRVGDRGQFDEDLKQFPRPSHLDAEPVPKFGSYFSSSRPLVRGPHDFGTDMGPRAHEKEPHGLNFDPMIGSGPSQFLPPYHDAGERPVGLPEDTLGRTNFRGTVPSYGRHRMDGFVSRSPGREYPGISPRGFRGHPGDEIDARERRFNDRFSGLPGHLHRGGVESSDHMVEHLRSRDMIGPDIRPPHFRMGEHLGHPNMPGHLLMGEPIGFGDFSSHERMGEFGGPGNFRHPRLGEPGFRSSFSLREFPNDGGIYTGDMDSFENLRKRKPVSMGWCRICKVDCETVEGLDLHSQTREHQKMAMDMVVTIKQNAKKQKLTSGDHSIHNDSSKSKNTKFEGRVNKH
ncbi:uncharacterized protein LOC111286507 [Durio zibethinus]|uniref:Uncharacterized protein LOC111286507 n=1 Tax=Durio zibethinus TaxID=66656 RepID=A0A6P5XWQ8_DURZI|nr:uncharacterized protein LOC111286507 [Durio zibethinus]